MLADPNYLILQFDFVNLKVLQNFCKSRQFGIPCMFINANSLQKCKYYWVRHVVLFFICLSLFRCYRHIECSMLHHQNSIDFWIIKTRKNNGIPASLIWSPKNLKKRKKMFFQNSIIIKILCLITINSDKVIVYDS